MGQTGENGARFDASLAVGHIARVGQNSDALFIIDYEGAFGGHLRKMIQRGIDPRNEGEKADIEQYESLKEAFHKNEGYA